MKSFSIKKNSRLHSKKNLISNSNNEDIVPIGVESGLRSRYATRFMRLPTREVSIGNVTIGGNNSICLQSMTTSPTENIEEVVQEVLRICDAGAAIVRITTQNAKAVESLIKIKSRLRQLGNEVPLVADVHFTPNAALLAAEVVEKVRINPGNFVDKKRLVLKKYEEESFLQTQEKILERFLPLLDVCKKNNTTLRIGVNHGSLSDRIVHRYGDSPLGMVESAYEYLNIAKQQNFHRLVFSMKSSNTIVMVHAYRMMALRMEQEEMLCYPFHLGVTEAGDEEQGRVKSATGIASLLCDGIGDTVRVSLTEPAENELPVAAAIVAVIADMTKNEDFLFPPILLTESVEKDRGEIKEINNSKTSLVDEQKAFTDFTALPVTFKKKRTIPTNFFGGNKTPKVYVSLPNESLEKLTPASFRNIFSKLGYTYDIATDKWHSSDISVDGVLLMGRAGANNTASKILNTKLTAKLNVNSEINGKEIPMMATCGIENSIVADLQMNNIQQLRSDIIIFNGLSSFSNGSFWQDYQENKGNENEWLLVLNYEEAAALASSSSLLNVVKKMEGHLSLLLNFSNEGCFIKRVRNAVMRLRSQQVNVPILLQFSEAFFLDSLESTNNKKVKDKSIEYSNDKIKLDNYEGRIEEGAAFLERRLVCLTAYTAPLFVDGLLDGVVLHWLPSTLLVSGISSIEHDVDTMFSMLQATRQRIAKPEYISCPSCGRTLFNLQTVTAKIKARTAHLKGVKIGIMGCIVNGPGEMADADFGYVGAGVGLITLYKGQSVVRKNIPESEAVDVLLELIKQHGMWTEP